MWKWLQAHWSTGTVIAVVALAQPWVIWLYRKYGKGGHLDVHHTGNVEVGFSGLGATIALQGTLRAVDRDFFVSSMSLRLVRESDGSWHRLEWGAFRPPAVLAGETKDPTEVPAGFMVQPLAPRRYNIVFFDTSTQAAVREQLDPVQRGFIDAVTINSIPTGSRRNYYDTEFQHNPLYQHAYTELDRIIYWQPGKYRIHLDIHTTRPGRNFYETWGFTLTANDVTALRNNRIPILGGLAGPTESLHFAYCPYR